MELLFQESRSTKKNLLYRDNMKKKCKIPYLHDFPDYPCKICNQQNSDWREALYVEALEDLIFYAKMFHSAKDKKEATEDIRNQIKKTEDFISSTIQSEIDKAVKERDLQITKLLEEYSLLHPDNPDALFIKKFINLITSPTRATMGDEE